jgi:hypothetical protein
MITFQDIQAFADKHGCGEFTPVMIASGDNDYFLGNCTVRVTGENESRVMELVIEANAANLFNKFFRLQFAMDKIQSANKADKCTVVALVHGVEKPVNGIARGSLDGVVQTILLQV